jgi:hypothetical protein
MEGRRPQGPGAVAVCPVPGPRQLEPAGFAPARSRPERGDELRDKYAEGLIWLYHTRHGSTWVPMGCAETSVMPLPHNYNQAARDALAHRPLTACGSRRSLAVAPLIGDQRCYGETPMRLRRDCRPISGNGPGGWRWVRGQRLASWGSQPGLELSTETPATGKGARPMRSPATDASSRPPFPRA